MTRVYLLMLKKDEGEAKAIFSELTKMGLAVDGHFFKDDIQNMGWAAFKRELEGNEYQAWIIFGGKEEWNKTSIRQGISLLYLGKGEGIKTIVLVPKGGGVSEKDLPFLLKGVDLVEMSPGFGAKIVAKVHIPSKEGIPPYSIIPYGVPGMGLWLEIGPRNDVWKGVLVGVKGAEIRHFGVGEKGSLPEKSVLEYPIRDMKLEIKGEEYVAWAVKNELSPKSAAYVNLSQIPEAIVFGPWDEESLEFFNLSLV